MYNSVWQQTYLFINSEINKITDQESQNFKNVLTRGHNLTRGPRSQK